MDDFLRRERKGIIRPIAGSALLHLAFFAGVLLFLTTEPRREFFTPVTVNILDRAALDRTTAAQRPERAPDKDKQEATEPVKKQAIPAQTKNARKTAVDEAVKDIAVKVKEKEASKLVESRINDLRKKEESESNLLKKRLNELKNRVYAEKKTSQQVQPVQPASRGGGASKATMDNRYAAYLSLISDRVQQEWGVLDEFSNLKTEIIVAVKIGRTGNLLDIRIEKSSGNAKFDQSLLNAVKKAVPFPPLPQEFKESFIETGFRYCPNCKG